MNITGNAPVRRLTPTGQKRTVLIGEDHLPLLRLLEVLLQREGFQVITAQDGVETLDVLSREIPDVLILDLDMPRLSGFEVCRRLGDGMQDRRVPHIIINSSGGSDAPVECLERLNARVFADKANPVALVEEVCRLVAGPEYGLEEAV